MPQGPLLVQNSPYPSLKSALNITTPTVLKVGRGNILSIIVAVAGSSTGGVYDLATDAPAAGSLIAVIPDAVGPVQFGLPYGFPYTNGLLIVPGTGQTVSVAYQ